jgi:hypothetical protein
MQKQKARGPVKSGSPLAVAIQWRKSHSIYSKRGGAGGYRRSDRSRRRDRHTAGSRLRRTYSMPSWTQVRGIMGGLP